MLRFELQVESTLLPAILLGLRGHPESLPLAHLVVVAGEQEVIQLEAVALHLPDDGESCGQPGLVQDVLPLLWVDLPLALVSQVVDLLVEERDQVDPRAGLRRVELCVDRVGHRHVAMAPENREQQLKVLLLALVAVLPDDHIWTVTLDVGHEGLQRRTALGRRTRRRASPRHEVEAAVVVALGAADEHVRSDHWPLLLGLHLERCVAGHLQQVLVQVGGREVPADEVLGVGKSRRRSRARC